MKRKYGNGYIYRRGSRWWIRFSVRGRRHDESSGSGKLSVARTLLAKRIAEVRSGHFAPEAGRVTLADLCSMLINDYITNARRSLPRLRCSLRQLRNHFDGDTRAVDITAAELAAYKAARLGEGAKAGTVNRELAALGRAFVIAIEAGKLASAPRIKKLAEAAPRAGFFERAELDLMLSELPDYLHPMMAAYITGWRTESELLTRQRRHLDLDGGWLRLDPGETKNREGRNFPLTPELREIFTEQAERTRELELKTGIVIPWLFHHDGKPIRSFWNAWNGARRRAGLVGHIPHDFRRTAIRNLERAGVPRSAAMKMTGHLTESVYRRYAIVDKAMLEEAAAKLAALHQAEDRTRKVEPLGRRRQGDKKGTV